ncbi:MAG TPA: adenylate kinase [Candidatus Eremiobacteraceae bacterium]|nr:adenylate kinase [Candidatus Eremiobacteraceae bacterium]
MSDNGYRLLLLGAPGAGKGTQAELLTRRLGLPHIATGDMFRAAKAAGSPMGVLARKYMDKGELVPDALTIGIVDERLQQPDVAQGWILDGFPRTPVQAAALDALLARLGQRLDAVVKLTVPNDELIRRLTGRRVCPNCGTNYNVVSAPPKMDDVCDHCRHALEQREDDTEATVSHRLDVYDKSTRPLIAFYEKKGLLHRVDGTQPVDTVHRAIVEAANAGAQVQPT